MFLPLLFCLNHIATRSARWCLTQKLGRRRGHHRGEAKDTFARRPPSGGLDAASGLRPPAKRKGGWKISTVW